MTNETYTPNKNHTPDLSQADWDKKRALIQEETDRILAEIKQRDQLQNPTPLENNLVRPLVQQMQQALQHDKDADMQTTLKSQAIILDKAFRRLLTDAETQFENNEKCTPNFAHYVTAFRAQDIYCRTARAVKILENMDKSQKMQKPKKTKRIKRTERICHDKH